MTSDPYLVFGSPIIGAEEIAAVTRTLETAWIGTGPQVHELESQFAAYTRAKHALATSSCTAALHLGMVAAGVGPGDEVITTPMTFCATANAIIHTGATPVFADCQADTMNIDPAAIEAAVTSRTKAIVPVHFAGRPADMDAIAAIARRHSLIVIEDAAHAIESVYKRQKIGSISALTCFSFYVTKNMTTGEGGMVTTNDPDIAKKIKVCGLHGLSADAWSRFSDTGYKHYDVVFPGFKYNLTDMAASLGLVQLPKLEGWLARRAEIWARYDEAFADLPVVRPLPPEADTVHARHLYILQSTIAPGLARPVHGRNAQAPHRHRGPLPRSSHPSVLRRAFWLPPGAVPEGPPDRRTHRLDPAHAEAHRSRRRPRHRRRARHPDRVSLN